MKIYIFRKQNLFKSSDFSGFEILFLKNRQDDVLCFCFGLVCFVLFCFVLFCLFFFQQE